MYTVFCLRAPNVRLEEGDMLPIDLPPISPEEAYNNWHESTEPQVLQQYLLYIARSEFVTFMTLMDKYYTRKQWSADLAFTSLPSFPVTNYTSIVSEDPAIEKQAAALLYSRSRDLTDVYEKDVEEHARVFIITKEGTYLGHVYQELSYNEPRDSGLIGIRTSILNMVTHLYGGQTQKGLAYVLLDAYRMYFASRTDYDTLCITNPIGPMLHVAERYGFIDQCIPVDFVPTVPIPKYILISF